MYNTTTPATQFERYRYYKALDFLLQSIFLLQRRIFPRDSKSNPKTAAASETALGHKKIPQQ